jgi:farnesyl-diphosphate farnesyltransferase
MTTEEIKEYPYRFAGVGHYAKETTDQSSGLSHRELQAHLLKGVSRTFALTIPQLPEPLAWVVSNAYLLCRIVDTIEDEPALNLPSKRYFCRQFVNVVAGAMAPEKFASELAPYLSESTIPAEHALIRYTSQVIAITHSFNERQQEALYCCVKLMAEGMVEFQEGDSLCGLKDLRQMDRYCYHVAGVVGEMLTKLFCDYSPDIAKNEDALMKLAVSFGQGLQMTNILKDIWDDRSRGACWLPQDIFDEVGFDLRQMDRDHSRPTFGQGLAHLIGIAYGHLNNALTYTLLIPKHETGIRHFCLWAIGLAVLTLRKINKHRTFSSGNEVKVSRRSVKATIITSRLAVAHDHMLKSLFHLAGIGLPNAPEHRNPRDNPMEK